MKARRRGSWASAVALVVVGGLAGALGSSFGPGPSAAWATERYADFVYVDANEGSASGGHVALRLDDRTYHFGYHEPGFLRLDRDESARFAHVYGVLENRNLQILRIAVTEETFDGLRASFNERYLTESAEFSALGGLARDVAFAEAWAAGAPVVWPRGNAYLRPSNASPDGASGASVELRSAIERRYGRSWLSARVREAETELRGLSQALEEPVPALAPMGAHPARGYGVAKRASDAQARLEAFRLLAAGAALRPEARIELENDAFAIDAEARVMLAELAGRMKDDLVAAAGSDRPDVGFVLLVGMARWLAVEQTLREGRLVVLDVFPRDAHRYAVRDIRAQGARLAPMAAELAGELGRVHGALLSKRGAVRESDYAALEALANRYHEVEESRSTGDDLRAAPGRLLPARSVARRLSLPGATPALPGHLRELGARQRALAARLGEEHHYSLLGHNCVSELFAQIERATAHLPGAGGTSPGALGGHVEPGRGFEFIPFVAAEKAARTYEIDHVEERPSYRIRRVQEMEEHEGRWVAIREGNVLTSTAYQPNAADSAFLFFTDDVFVARPLLGAANLLYGLGAAVAGLPLAVFDDGGTVGAGLRGALWSLPELAFFNVRKGSYFHVPRAPSVPTAADDR